MNRSKTSLNRLVLALAACLCLTAARLVIAEDPSGQNAQPAGQTVNSPASAQKAAPIERFSVDDSGILIINEPVEYGPVEEVAYIGPEADPRGSPETAQCGSIVYEANGDLGAINPQPIGASGQLQRFMGDTVTLGRAGQHKVCKILVKVGSTTLTDFTLTLRLYGHCPATDGAAGSLTVPGALGNCGAPGNGQLIAGSELAVVVTPNAAGPATAAGAVYEWVEFIYAPPITVPDTFSVMFRSSTTPPYFPVNERLVLGLSPGLYNRCGQTTAINGCNRAAGGSNQAGIIIQANADADGSGSCCNVLTDACSVVANNAACFGPWNMKFTPGGDCSSECFIPSGACCIPTGAVTCDIMSVNDCLAISGQFLGASSTCEAEGFLCGETCNSGHDGQVMLLATAGASDTNLPYIRYENFSPAVDGNITSLSWWGTYFIPPPVGFLACPVQSGDSPDDFTVTYHASANDEPGPVIAGPFSVTPVKNDTLRNFNTSDIFKYTATHPPVAVQTNVCYWVSVLNHTTADCAWYWITGVTTDGHSEGSADGVAFAAETFDLSLCLNIDLQPDACIGSIEIGACCHGDGATCTIETVTTCAAIGANARFYVGRVCADIDCTQGACCYLTTGVGLCPDQPTCVLATQAGCAVLNPTGYQGDGSTCSDANLPAECNTLIAACCYVDAANPTCYICTETDCLSCEALGGFFQDTSPTCSADQCAGLPVPGGGTGSCGYCCDAGVCDITNETDCTGDSWIADTTAPNCSPNPCPQPGACCLAPDDCQIFNTEALCVANLGTFLGGGTTCTDGGLTALTRCDCNANGTIDQQEIIPPKTIEFNNVNVAIPDSPDPGISNVGTVTSSGIIQDVDVGLLITHSYIGDLEISVSHLGTTVVLWNLDCADEGNLNSTIDDEGTDTLCASAPLGARYQSYDFRFGLAGLAAFDGLEKNGDWTLLVNDLGAVDTGTLVSWSLTIDNDEGPGDCNGNAILDECETPDPDTQGACCDLRNGDCSVTTEAGCDEASGDFVYRGNCTNCSPNPCTPPPTGKCCMPDDSCVTNHEYGCGLAGGAYGGDGSDCTHASLVSAPGQAIPDNDLAGVIDLINIPTSATILDVDIDLAVDHTAISQVVATVSHNGTTVALWGGGCGTQDNFDLIFDDEGDADGLCSEVYNGFRITPLGLDDLFEFDGMDVQGDWTIKVFDNVATETGSLVRWSVHYEAAAVSPCAVPCACEGDVDSNGIIDGRDVQGYADCQLGDDDAGDNCACATQSIADFVNSLLFGHDCTPLVCVPPGQDCWETSCGQTKYSFADNPIPASFFDPGSQPFDGIIMLGGGASSPDTLVQRLAPLCFAEPLPAVADIPIEIVQLSLVSCAPINVIGSGQWNVAVDLSPASSPTGSMTATKTHPNGGTFDSALPVQPRFTFTKVGSPTTIRVLDTGLEGIPPVTLSSSGAPWVHVALTGLPCSGQNFVPGVDEGENCCTEICHSSFGTAPHEHCVLPPDCSACPP